ncbi:hypothetical protein NECAME_06681 [Necator americanus]|uniref:Uncharacterized protein n=1 Tax=Necator americanus TaxID=51031 RepID=W2TUU0_NECAM|nr:hypothetical protein NECAME_06681 [Necator americanus]ETN84797.1 hypothetical protein NECAME_06681 [Necator americanus]
MVLLYAIRHGQYVSLLLCIIASLNCIAAASLLSSKRSFASASAIAVFVIWKIFQEIVLVPVLLIFTFLIAEVKSRELYGKRKLERGELPLQAFQQSLVLLNYP